MKTYIKTISLILATTTSIFAQGNALMNPSFEQNQVATINNVAFSAPLSHWSSTTPTNTMRTNAMASSVHGGPAHDATYQSMGVVRQHVDFDENPTKLYQSFIAQHDGFAVFGGSFATQMNNQHNVSISIVQGVGLHGPVVAHSGNINLTVQNSTQWKQVMFAANLTKGQKYTYIVTATRYSLFDEAFVYQSCTNSHLTARTFANPTINMNHRINNLPHSYRPIRKSSTSKKLDKLLHEIISF